MGKVRRKEIQVLTGRKMRSAIFGKPAESLLSEMDKLRAELYKLERQLRATLKDYRLIRRKKAALLILIKKVKRKVAKEEKKNSA